MNSANNEYYKRKADLVWNEIESEMIIIDPENGYVHLLNATGKRIFEFLECPQSTDSLYENIIATFECSENDEGIKRDIIDFIDEMIENGLVQKGGV